MGVSRTSGATPWALWRQDDNGNRFRIARFATRAAADAEQRRFEGPGHKQTYGVERGQATPGVTTASAGGTAPFRVA